MNNYDPRIEKIFSKLRVCWYRLSPKYRDLIWSYLKKIQSIRKHSFNRINTEQNASVNLHIRAKAQLPSDAEWANLKKRITKGQKKYAIDVIIPVYAGTAETLRCIYSVLCAKTNIAFQLILIDDSSPEADLVASLENLKRDFDDILLIKNKTNLGFVKSTNLGMKVHPERDVVWLNSDTEVFDYWLDRLVNLAAADKSIGTITPLTNNSTISSYPSCNLEYSSNYDVKDSVLDAMAASLNHDTYLSAPTGVGCCMYIRRKALNEVGLLDEERFGKGYGEENDLCQRILKAGWKNAIYPGIFIRHYGAVSFSVASEKRKQRASKVLAALHPNYPVDIQKWVQNDPLRIARLRLDCARLAQKFKLDNKKRVLIVTHNLGGGVETFVQDLRQKLLSEHIESVIMRPENNGTIGLESSIYHYPNLHGITPGYDYEVIKEILLNLKISNIHINHLASYPEYFGDLLIELSKDLKIPITYTLHDYYPCCPFVNTFVSGNWNCESISEGKCDLCSKQYHVEAPWLLRNRSKRLFKACKKVTVPSEDMKKRLEGVFPLESFIVVPHHENFMPPIEKKNRSEQNFTIAVLGAILSDAKGSSFVCKLAEELKDNHSDVRLILIGSSDRPKKLIKAGVSILGAYKNEQEVRDILQREKVDVCMIPSVCPETYCYTLSIGLRSGLPTFVFDLGAQAERLKDMGITDWIIPYDRRNDADFVISFMQLNSKTRLMGCENSRERNLYAEYF